MAAVAELLQSPVGRIRLCETGCRCCSCFPCSAVIATIDGTARPVLSVATLSQQTRRQHDRRYPSQNCAWKVAAVDLLVNIVLALTTSVASHSAAAPLRGSRILRAVSATDVARKFDRPSNGVDGTTSTVLQAEFWPRNSNGFLRDAVRQTVSGTWKNGDFKSRAEEKHEHETPRSPRGMSMFPESKHPMAESSRNLVAPRSAGDLAEWSKGRIVVRRQALSENGVATAGPPPTSGVNYTSAVLDVVAERLASDSSQSSITPTYGSSPINSDTETRTRSHLFSDPTTPEHAPTEFEDSTTEDILEILRKAIEAAFTTAQIDPEEETQQVSQTTKSEDTSSTTNGHTIANETEASFTKPTTAYVTTPVTAWDQNKSSTIATDTSKAIGPSVKSDIPATAEPYLVTVSASAPTAQTNSTSVQRDATLSRVNEELHVTTSVTTVDALGTSAFSSLSNQHPETATNMAAMSSTSPPSGSGVMTTDSPGTATWPPPTPISRTANVTAYGGISTSYVSASGAMSVSPASSTAGEPLGGTTPDATPNATSTAPAAYNATAIATPSRSTVTTWATSFASTLSTDAGAAGTSTTTFKSTTVTTLFIPLTTPGALSTSAVPDASLAVTSSASTSTRPDEIPPQTSTAGQVTTTAAAIGGSAANQTTTASAGATPHMVGGNSTTSSVPPFASVSLAAGATSTRTPPAASTATSQSTSSITGSPGTANELVTMSTDRAVSSTTVATFTSAHATFGHSAVTSPATEVTSESENGGAPSSTVTTEIGFYTTAVSAKSLTFGMNVSATPSAAITPATTVASAASSTEIMTIAALSTPSTINWTVSAQSTAGQSVLLQASTSSSSVTDSGDRTSENATLQTIIVHTFNVTTLAATSADHSLSAESSPSEPIGHTSPSEPTTSAPFAKNSTSTSNPVLPPSGAAVQENSSSSAVGQLLAWAIPVAILGAVAIIGVVVAIAFIRKRRGSMWLHRGGRNDSGAAAVEAARSGGDYDSVGSP